MEGLLSFLLGPQQLSKSGIQNPEGQSPYNSSFTILIEVFFFLIWLLFSCKSFERNCGTNILKRSMGHCRGAALFRSSLFSEENFQHLTKVSLVSVCCRQKTSQISSHVVG